MHSRNNGAPAPHSATTGHRPPAQRRTHTVIASVGDWVWWVVSLTGFWVVATLAGGLLLGIAPASATAAALVRERDLSRHDRIWRDGPRMWARNFLRSQLALLPLIGAVAILGTNYLLFSGLGQEESAARVATLLAGLLVIAASSWAAPLFVHFEVPGWRVPFLAVRLVLARPFSSVLLCVTGAALLYVVSVLPALALAAPGTWWTASTLLCLRFFDDNARRLGQREAESSDAVLALPTEPLRIH